MRCDDLARVLRLHTDALNRHDIDSLVALYAGDAVIVSPMFDTVKGREAVRRSFERLFTVYPDYRMEMADSSFIAEGDRAAQFGTVTATPRTDLFGLPPTGQPIEYHTSRLFTFDGGLIACEQRLYDFHGVLDRLEKARTDQDLAIAAAVQQMLQARADRRGGYFEVVGSSLPCRAIGGDFLECTDLPSGRVAIGLGDVSGKGPPAALVATMLQGMLSAITETDVEPSTVLSRVNRGLCRRAISPRFATLVYGVLGPDGRFVYSNAGHNPLIRLTASGPVLLTSGGVPLGIFEQAAYPDDIVHLEPGETVIAFSDGATDAADSHDEPFGMERLIACAHANRTLPPAALLESILRSVEAFSQGAPPGDDVTIVVTRFR